ncbi:MAG: hypothetical protein KGZ96_06590 [Clostridia bacterium]|jgi:hypothetical protein|nr:hypothetical protein [Clostridia bacterium]
MKRVTVSTKVHPDITNKIAKAGFQISDTLQVGLELFLDLPRDEQWNRILRQQITKKNERAWAKFKLNPYQNRNP